MAHDGWRAWRPARPATQNYLQSYPTAQASGPYLEQHHPSPGACCRRLHVALPDGHAACMQRVSDGGSTQRRARWSRVGGTHPPAEPPQYALGRRRRRASPPSRRRLRMLVERLAALRLGRDRDAHLLDADAHPDGSSVDHARRRHWFLGRSGHASERAVWQPRRPSAGSGKAAQGLAPTSLGGAVVVQDKLSK